MGEVRKAEREEKRAIEQMNFALNDAERKERMGNTRAAQAALEAARKFQQDANKAKADKLRFSADIATRNVRYSQLANKGAGDKEPKVAEQLARAELAYARNPTKENLIDVEALRRTQDRLAQKQTYSVSEIPTGGAKDTNAKALITSRENTAAQTALNDFKARRTQWRKFVESHGGDEAKATKAYKEGWKTLNPKAGAEDFDPENATEYNPTAKPAAAPSVSPGTRLKFNAAGEEIK
jgi:hypothetical protein